MTLKQKTIAGMVWSFAEQFSAKFIGMIITIFLARILAPAEFGLIAMLSIFISVGNSLTDSGLASSLIRSGNAGQKDFSTVFFFNLLGSLLIYLLLFLAAPFIAAFYKQPILTDIVRVYGLAFILNAFYTVQSARLTKEMNFKVQTMIKIPSVLGGGLVGIVLANLGYGAWSLVWMSLCNSLISTLMFWIYSGWTPSFIFDIRSFKQHFQFGYKMTLSGILETLYQNIYVIVIGKYYSPTQLGYFSRADSISQLPISNLSAALNKVTYPMFAAISQDNEKLKSTYRKVMQQVIFWNAPALIFLSVVAEPLFRFLLTEKWLPAVPYFQILCLAGIMYPLHAYNLNILKVKGRSDLLLKVEFFKKVASVAGIFFIIPFGIYGLLYFQLALSIIYYFVNGIYSGKLIDYTVQEQVKDIYPSMAIAMMIGFLCRLLDLFLVQRWNAADIDRIVISGFFYSIIYLSCSNMIKLPAITDFKHLILKK